MSTIIATYKNMNEANAVVDHLITNGISRDEISIATLENNTTTTKTAAGHDSSISGAVSGAAGETMSGAVGGATLGGVLGLLAGVAALSIPGLGPLLIAGPIATSLGLGGIAATTVSAAGAGGAIGGLAGLVGHLVKAGISEADAHEVESTLQSGGVLVSVKDTQLATGTSILEVLNSGNPSKLLTVQ